MKKQLLAIITAIAALIGYAEARIGVVLDHLESIKPYLEKVNEAVEKLDALEEKLPAGALEFFKPAPDADWQPKSPTPPIGVFLKKSLKGNAMKTYTVDEAIALIMGDRPGARICSLVTRTVPRLYAKHPETGKPCPYAGRLVKVAERSGMIRVKYQNAVNNQRAREGRPLTRTRPRRILPFQAGQLWHGRGVHDTPETLRHAISGRRYLSFKPKTDDNGDVIVRRELYLLDDKPLNAVRLRDWLKPASRPRNQGIKRVIRWRTLPLESIVQITCGDLYVIRHPAELKRAA